MLNRCLQIASPTPWDPDDPNSPETRKKRDPVQCHRWIPGYRPRIARNRGAFTRPSPLSPDSTPPRPRGQIFAPARSPPGSDLRPGQIFAPARSSPRPDLRPGQIFAQAGSSPRPDLRPGRIFAQVGSSPRPDLRPGRIFAQVGSSPRPDPRPGRICGQARSSPRSDLCPGQILAQVRSSPMEVDFCPVWAQSPFLHAVVEPPSKAARSARANTGLQTGYSDTQWIPLPPPWRDETGERP
jgi:hypothetical protein